MVARTTLNLMRIVHTPAVKITPHSSHAIPYIHLHINMHNPKALNGISRGRCMQAIPSQRAVLDSQAALLAAALLALPAHTARQALLASCVELLPSSTAAEYSRFPSSHA